MNTEVFLHPEHNASFHLNFSSQSRPGVRGREVFPLQCLNRTLCQAHLGGVSTLQGLRFNLICRSFRRLFEVGVRCEWFVYGE